MIGDNCRHEQRLGLRADHRARGDVQHDQLGQRHVLVPGVGVPLGVQHRGAAVGGPGLHQVGLPDVALVGPVRQHLRRVRRPGHRGRQVRQADLAQQGAVARAVRAGAVLVVGLAVGGQRPLAAVGQRARPQVVPPPGHRDLPVG